MSNLGLVWKKHNQFTTEEIVGMLITSVLAGFFLSFDDWGVDGYDVMVGIENFLLATFAVFLILAVVILAQKFAGSIFGYKITYHTAWIGLVVGFFVTTLTYGAFPFFLPGGINYDLVRTQRLGKFNWSYKPSEMFVIASMAISIPLLFALIFGILFVGTESVAFRHITVAALLFALFALIPTPRLKSPHRWGLHGVSEIRFIKHLDGGTFGYDLAEFNLLSYSIFAVFTLVFAGLVILFQIFSLVLAAILTLLAFFVYKIAIPYITR